MTKNYFLVALILLIFSFHGYSNSFSEVYEPIVKSGSVTVTPIFNAYGPYCQNSIAPALPTTSLNGISGTWSPSSINTNLLGVSTYTFTPNIGQDAVTASITITIDLVPAPPISIGNITECALSPLQTLNANNGIMSIPGQMMSWYDAATIGNLIANPTLSTIGTVTYYAESNNGTCSSSTRTAVTLTILPASNAGILTGVQNICVGFTTTFTSTATGGVWSSSDTTVATVNPVTGVVTGMAAGVATLTYTVAGVAPCVNGTATRIVTVNAPPVQPSIEGFQGICVGSWTVFTANPSGGTWSSSNNAVAMVDFTGFILGNSAGVATISYTISGSGGCADRTAVRNVTVSTPPTIVLSSAPNTANQTVCENTPITPIIYSIGTLSAQDAMAISLPPGVSGSYNAGVFTISGTPTASGTFPYSATAVGPCGSDSLLGTITVSPSISTTMFCDPSGVIAPNAVRIDWANIVGATNFQFAYSIDNGPIVTGATNISNYEILGVLPGQSVTFTLTNAVGISCFQSISVTCANLAKESFEIDAFQSFPNPVSNVLNLASSQTINNVAIINTLGQAVLNQIYNAKSIQIDMSRFASGIYMVKLSADTKSKSIKIIKD